MELLAAYLRNVKRYWKQALIVGLITALLAGAVSAFLNRPSYVSTATVALRPVGLVAGDVAGQQALQQLSATVPMVVASQSVLSRAGASLEPPVPVPMLERTVNFRVPSPSLVFTIATVNDDPQRGESIVRAIIREFKADVDAGALKGGTGNLSLAVARDSYQTSELPGSALGMLSSVVAGLMAGLLIGLLYLFARVILANRFMEPADIARVTDDSVVAVVEPGDEAGLAQLASGLDYLVPGTGSRSLAVASADRDTTDSVAVASGLARHLGGRATLVDLDLRHRPLGDGPGLADLVAGRAVDLPRGTVPAGGPVPNPGELLAHERTAGVLARLRDAAPWTLVNAGSLIASSEGVLAARQADAVLVTVTGGRTSRHQLQEALNVLAGSGVRCAGIVFVRAAQGREKVVRQAA